jgi:hypothetical protein
MTKKGKFKFASYLIEDHLIFYKGPKQMMTAFTVLCTSNFNKILPILTKMLEKQYFEYFSWQIMINKERQDSFIINFKGTKAGIIKAYNLIEQELKNLKFKNLFLKKKILKITFFEILSQELNSRLSRNKSVNTITINDQINAQVLRIFELNLSLFVEYKNLFENFIKYLRDLGKKFVIYFNFHIDRFNLISNYGILIEYLNQKNELIDLDEEINNFFTQSLVNKLKIQLKHIMNLLWRRTFPSSKMFHQTSHFFLDYNKDFEYKLIVNDLLGKFDKNEISYYQINEQLFFIEDHTLFIIVEKLDLDLLSSLIKKYYPKYRIMILFLNEGEYTYIMNFNQIKKLEDLRILRMKDLVEFNYSILKIN